MLVDLSNEDIDTILVWLDYKQDDSGGLTQRDIDVSAKLERARSHAVAG